MLPRPRGQPQIILIRRSGPAPLSAAPGPPGGIYLPTPAKVVDVEGFTLVRETVTPVLRCWEQAPVLPSLSDPLRTADFPGFIVPGPRTFHNSSGALPYSGLTAVV